MNENDDQSPYGRGFIAASIIIAAVLLCGAVLLIAGLTSGTPQAAGEPVQSTSGDGVGNSPAVQSADGSTGQPATPAGEARPGSTGDPGAGSGSARSNSASCSLPAGDQTIPIKPPSVDGWDVSRRVVVPRSASIGPAKTDPDGFRRCFAQSPTGAVFAAYNVVAALADQRQAIPTVQKLMLPGPDTQALIRELRAEEPSTDSDATQLAGYRVLDANQDRATIMLALPVESAYMSITLTLVWHDNDWRLQPPPPGEPVGSPFAQHRDLTDFVTWSGV
ncbi:hypothetical protein AB0F43_18740 [Kribbella sp. NPDC023972]|uniref:hypothetical protein n=1 Tax=Kribbella sp. NPDC023972 TaxID=3154795 RepID=UPI00340E2B9B